MKFDLEAALQGTPVRLRDGTKAYIYFNLHSVNPPILTSYPLKGYLYEANEGKTISWTEDGYFNPKKVEHDFDIVEMWEDDPNDILATAYNQNKQVFVDNYPYLCDVVGKHKNGSWLLETEGRIFQLDKNAQVYFMDTPKSGDVRSSLPFPIKVTGTQRVWFIRGGMHSNQLVVDCKTAQPSETFIKQGNCFKSKKDALAWINALTILAGNE